MTEELFRNDATLAECEARMVAVAEGGVVLDRTVFYPQGGGQAGDAGVLRLADGREIAVIDTLHTNEPIDKEALNAGIARLVAEAHLIRHR